jgi:hypothetical protein
VAFSELEEGMRRPTFIGSKVFVIRIETEFAGRNGKPNWTDISYFSEHVDWLGANRLSGKLEDAMPFATKGAAKAALRKYLPYRRDATIEQVPNLWPAKAAA